MDKTTRYLFAPLLLVIVILLSKNVQGQSGPFDVTTIVRLNLEANGSNWNTAKISVHARTNALGLPLKIGGSVIAPSLDAQIPECAAYGKCDGWDIRKWKREASPGPVPPIEPQRLDGDPIAVGERVRVRLITVRNSADLTFGICSNKACSIIAIRGVAKDFRLRYQTAVSTSPNVRNFGGEWTGDVQGPENATFEEGKVYNFIVHRVTPWIMKLWHENNENNFASVALEPDRVFLRLDSGTGTTAFVRDGEKVRLNGDPIAVGERVRVHLTNRDHVWLTMGICSQTNCSVVRVESTSRDNRMNYNTWVTRSDSLRQDNEALSEVTNIVRDNDIIYAGTNIFVIHRRSETEMNMWMEYNPDYVVKIPLAPDRQYLKIESHSGVATFLDDKVFWSNDCEAVMVSPPVEYVEDGSVCVSVVYLASTKNSGILVNGDLGTSVHTLGRINPDRAGVWRYSRVTLTIPQRLRLPSLRLSISPVLVGDDSKVLVQRVAGCNTQVDEDVANFGEIELPLSLPGYNVSWGSPRPARAAASRWCANGGATDDFGACVCPPGFTGETCTKGCGANRYGFDCGGICSTVKESCVGMMLCGPGQQCSCAPGYTGELCNVPCPLGRYGGGCALTCHYCKDGKCDPHTGLCDVSKSFFFGNDCGKPPRSTQLVSGGKPAPLALFPWHAAIYQKDATQDVYKYICGAALVTRRLLLSAAHCFYSTEYDSLHIPTRNLYVALGKIQSSWTSPEKAVHKSRFASVRLPDRFLGYETNLAYDLAIIELKDPIPPENKDVTPICVDPTIALKKGDSLRIAGFGAGSVPLSELSYVVLPFTPSSDCVRESSKTFKRFITADKFCSHNTAAESQGLARGDSGGAAVIEKDGIWFLQGIVSARDPQAFTYAFTNVSFPDHLQWLSENIPSVSN